MPKVYNTEFSIGNLSFSDIKDQGVSYFTKKLSGILDASTTDADLFIANKSGERFYVDVMSADEARQAEESGELQKIYVDTKNIDGDN